MPRPQQPIPILQPRSRTGGGAASLSQVAIAGFIDDQNKAQKSMMRNFSQLQEAQAAEASQSSAQMTNAMNQVVRRQDEKGAREERMQEKQGDREYQERFFEFTKKFEEQAVRDFTSTQTRVASQLDAGRKFVQRMDEDRVVFGDRIRAMRLSLYSPASIEGWKKTPGGLAELEKRVNQLRVAESFHETDRHSDYTREVEHMMGQVQEQILAGEAHPDLTQLFDLKPRDIIAGEERTSVAEDEWTDDEVEELWHSGGMIPGGMYGRDPEDPTLQKYRHFNPVEFVSHAQMMEDEHAFSVMRGEQLVGDWGIMRMKTWVKKKRVLDDLHKISNKHYDMLAPEAASNAFSSVKGFITDIGSGRTSVSGLTSSLVLNSGQFAGQDVRNSLATKMLEGMFVSIAGPGSDLMLQDLNSLLSGEGPKGLLDTDVEMHKGFVLRNILRHIDNQVLALSVVPAAKVDPKTGKTKGVDPLTMVLAAQIHDMPNSPLKGELIRAITLSRGDVERGERLESTVYNSATGELGPLVLGQLHDGMNRILSMVKVKAMELHDVVEAQPSMLTYQMRQSSSIRYGDAIVASAMSGEQGADLADPKVRARALGQATPEDFSAAFGEDEQGLEQGFDLETETLKEAVKLSPFQAASELYAGITSNPEMIAALFAGDYDLTSVTIPEVTKGSVGEVNVALEQYMEASKKRREQVRAEMKRRREGYKTAHPQPDDESEQVQPPVR